MVWLASPLGSKRIISPRRCRCDGPPVVTTACRRSHITRNCRACASLRKERPSNKRPWRKRDRRLRAAKPLMPYCDLFELAGSDSAGRILTFQAHGACRERR